MDVKTTTEPPLEHGELILAEATEAMKRLEPKPLYTSLAQRRDALVKMNALAALAASGQTLLVIEDEETAAVAGEYRARAKKLIAEVDAERLETTAGLRQLVDFFNARFNTWTSKLLARVSAVDGALKTYMAAKAERERQARLALEQAQREEQAKREAEAAELGVEPPPPPPPVTIAPAQDPFKITGFAGSTTGMRDNWKWRVIDIDAVDEAYLVPPAERIQKTVMNAKAKAIAKAELAKLKLGPNDKVPETLRSPDLPGIELYNDPHLASR